MTIKGIWDWATTQSRKVSINELRNKKLAIDGHIWLYECYKGCSNNNQSKASYLITFFRRCRWLMEEGITPIVLFDNQAVTTSSNGQECYVARKRRSAGGTHLQASAGDVHTCTKLLKAMGVNTLIAAGDGEAQCAYLEQIGAVDGCITTDFDYLLFGGKNLYKMTFENGRGCDVIHLSMTDMSASKNLFRNKLIALAILLGCDYYEPGVVGIGVITGLEIIHEFGIFKNDEEEDDPMVILDRFTSYVRGDVPERSEDSEKKLRVRRKKYKLEENFPNCDTVIDAVRSYTNPRIFTYTLENCNRKPLKNDAEVETIFKAQCGWSAEKLAQEINKSDRRATKLHQDASQRKLHEFFTTSKKRFQPVVTACDSTQVDNSKKWEKSKPKKRTVVCKASPPVVSRKRAPKAPRLESDPDIQVIEIDDSD